MPPAQPTWLESVGADIRGGGGAQRFIVATQPLAINITQTHACNKEAFVENVQISTPQTIVLGESIAIRFSS